MMADVIHGMMLNGRKLALPNTSLDQDWKQVEVNDSSLQNNDYKCFYRVLNGVLYVSGILAISAYQSGPIYLVKYNSNWKFPPFKKDADAAILFRSTEDGYSSSLIHVDTNDALDNGYLIYVAYNGPKPNRLPINLAIPVV